MTLRVDNGAEKFSFTWKIENFSYCLQKNGKELQSPTFAVDTLSKTKWNLSVYPRGITDSNYVGLYLRRDVDNGPENITLDFLLSIRALDGLFKEIKEITFSFLKNRKTGYGHPNIKTLDEIFGMKGTGFLHHDTLTVRCLMWESKTQPLEIKQCFASTRVGVERKIFILTLEKFSTVQQDEKKTVQVELTSDKNQSLTINLFLCGGSFIEERIQIEIQMDTDEQTFATCEISLLDAKGKVACFERDEHWFEENKDQFWKFPPFITKSKLMEQKSLYLPNDTLTVLCEFAISHGVEYNEVEHTDCTNPFRIIKAISNDVDKPLWCDKRTTISNCSDSLRGNLLSLYKDEKFCDVILQTKNKTFPVHKAILGARSPVFCVMFERDMKENRPGIVEIEDLEDEIIHQMLLFMYTDTVESLRWDNAIKLYFAADKYEIFPLKQMCSDFLKANFKSSNVCDALVLSELHQDEEIKLATQDFIINHANEVIGSDEWKEFIRNKSHLAAETMHLVCMNKLKL